MFLLVCTVLMAGNVTQKMAAQKAKALFGQVPVQMVSAGDDVQPAYYVFNAQRTGNGFVILSAEDSDDAILGYSEHGTFDPQNMPPALSWWLKSYEQQAEQVRIGKAQLHRAPVIHEAIEPLVKTQWNQEEPYNGMLPINPIDSTRYKHTGCVATAMAQILKYWSSEKPVSAIPGYSYTVEYEDDNGQTQSANVLVGALNDTIFNYSIMQDSYTVGDTATQAGHEVAMLMRYCGQAAQMVYYRDQASAVTSGKFFAEYFGFNPYYQEVYRADFTSTAWDELIYGELAAKRPVIYSGSKVSNSGHAFICDGYKDGLYHINWGWGGHYNGYFKLSECNSYGTGTGAGNGLDGYSFNQEAIIRIQPEAMDPIGNNNILLTVADLKTSASSYSRISSSTSFTVPVTFTVWNKTGFTYTFDIGFGLYQGDKLLQTFTYTTSELQENQGYKNNNMSLVFGSTLSNGSYSLKAISRQAGTEEWLADVSANSYYIKLEVNGTKLSAETTQNMLQVNSVTVEGVKKVGSTLTADVDITNKGDMNYSPLYMFLNGTLVTGSGVNLSHGESDVIPLHFQASRAGTFPLVLCTGSDGTGIVWSGDLTIETRKDPTTLAVGSAKVTNAVRSGKYIVIMGSTMNLTIPIQNRDSLPYNDIIVVELWKNLLNNVTSYTQDRREYQEIEIAAGDTKNVNIEINNLDIGHRYFVYLYVFDSKGSLVPIGQTSAYPIIEDPSGIQSITIDSSIAPGTPVYDLSGRRIASGVESLSKGMYIVKGKKVLLK